MSGNLVQSCEWCGEDFRPARTSGRPAKFCTAKCRGASHRAQVKAAKVAATPIRKPEGRRRSPERTEDDEVTRERMGPIEGATYDEIEAVGRLGTSLAAKALWLARSMDDAEGETGSGRKALSTEHTAVMDRVLRVAEGAQGDELDDLEDELAARRGQAG